MKAPSHWPVFRCSYRDEAGERIVRFFTGDQDDLDKWLCDLPATFVSCLRIVN